MRDDVSFNCCNTRVERYPLVEDFRRYAIVGPSTNFLNGQFVARICRRGGKRSW